MTRCSPVFTILVAFTLVLSGWKADRATAGTIHHQYDELNRIVQTHYGDGSSATYRYDQSDNIVEITRGQPPADMNLELTACHISGPVSVNEKSAAHFIATAVFSQNGIPVLSAGATVLTGAGVLIAH